MASVLCNVPVWTRSIFLVLRYLRRCAHDFGSLGLGELPLILTEENKCFITIAMQVVKKSVIDDLSP